VNRRTTVTRFYGLIHLLLMGLFLTPPCPAQVSTANVMGIVQDSSNASIPDANVKLINTQTGTENSSRTAGDGAFVLSGVIPGIYTLQIDRQGFATTQLNGIVLNVGDTKSLLIRMKIGSIAESVTVDASGLTINSTDASVSTVVDRKFVGNIPLDGHSFQDLISMTPGIVTQSPQTTGQSSAIQGDFSVNGQSLNSNSFIVDGVSANINSGLSSGNSKIASTGSIGGATAVGTTQSLVSIDALQEFRVLSSTYAAEYGRTPGGQFTFLTRSGSNAVHGSVYNNLRNSVFDADDWFTHSLQSTPGAYHQNNFGGTFSAPLVLPNLPEALDKSFIFVSYEGLLLAQPTPPTYRYVPSVPVREEAPDALKPTLNTFPFPGNFVAGNPGDVESGFSAITFDPYSLPGVVNSTSIRMDHSFAPNLSVFFRYEDAPSHSQTRQLWSLTTNKVRTQTLTLGTTMQLSSTSNNEFRLGFAENRSSLNTRTEPFQAFLSPPPNLNTALGVPSYASARSVAYIHINGVGDSESSTDSAASSLKQWNLRNVYTLQAAKHLFKLGIDQRGIFSTVTPPFLSVEADFFDRQSMMNNSASSVVISKNLPASPHLNTFSAFAQDEWRISKTINLSLGLRWEIDPAPKGADGRDAYTVLGSVDSPNTLRLAPRGTPLWHTGFFNFAPRFGAAWTVDSETGKELIVRAGAGAFFDTGNQPTIGAFNGAGFASTAHFYNVPIPVAPALFNFSTSPLTPYADTTSFAFPTHLQLPYSIQWNVGLEKALGKDQAISISYVGADGRRLLQEQSRNVNSVNPSFGNISYFPSGLTSNYQSLQLKFQRSMAHGVQALGSYTYAHSGDYGSTDPRFPLKYGNSDLDVRHNVETAVSWDLPNPSKSGMARLLFAHWGMDGRLMARTGFPITLLGNLFSDPVTGSKYYSGVNLIPNRPLYLPNPQYPGGRVLNGGPNTSSPAFSLPDGSAQGDAARNFIRGFNAVQVNLAARREIHLRESLSLQLRTEVFNVTNRPNFGYVDPFFTDALFGQATKMLNQSFGSTGALYQQGGPRSIQFELKLVF
jgi:Carboxypeptidase regulatory-like domain/TonB dependent receptor